MLMDNFITKSTFDKPKMSHAFPENYHCKGTGNNDACKTQQIWKHASRYLEHKTDFSSDRGTYL